MTTVRALFLAANPQDTTRLALDEEIRQISNGIRMSDGRDVLDVVSAWAVRPDDLLLYLNQYRPKIVHFSGHGSPAGEIILVNEHGSGKPVSPQALKSLFTTLRDNIEIVFLNACYTREQAEAIGEVIDYVVGTNAALSDKAATAFATAFYRALGFGRTVREAFDQARTALLFEGAFEEDAPELLVRAGASPDMRLLDFRTSPSRANHLQIEAILEAKECEIRVVQGDVVDFVCDVVVLKYAQTFYGADRIVANRISDDPGRDIAPRVGDFVLIPTRGGISAKQALFVGVKPLYELGYADIREFSIRAVQILLNKTSNARHIAMTIHGPGFGLDEQESFLAQIAGLRDALREVDSLPFRQITIVERNQGRASRLMRVLQEQLPTGRLSIITPNDPGPSRLRLDDAGVHSRAKPHIFVAMPFSEDMEDTYIFGIQGPVNEAGYLCERVDLTTFTGDIMARIKSRIETASLVIADLTGSNANVYLEVGYAWGRNRPTLLLVKSGQQLKFDVQNQRCIIYKSIADLAKKLKTDLAALA